MKINFLFVMFLGIMLFFTKQTSAQDHGFGMGIILGEPTGLSAKLWTSKVNAFDFGLGVAVGGDRLKYKGSYNNESRIHFHMDYLWHSFNAIQFNRKISSLLRHRGKVQYRRRLRCFNWYKRRFWYSVASSFNSHRCIF